MKVPDITTLRSLPGLGQEVDQLSWRGSKAVERATQADTARAMATCNHMRSRGAVVAVAAQTDSMVSGMLSAMPIYDETDALFKAQLKQAGRVGLLSDVLGF